MYFSPNLDPEFQDNKSDSDAWANFGASGWFNFHI